MFSFKLNLVMSFVLLERFVPSLSHCYGSDPLHLDYCQQLNNRLTHWCLSIPPEKHQKISGFLMFLRSRERDKGHKIGSKTCIMKIKNKWRTLKRNAFTHWSQSVPRNMSQQLTNLWESLLFEGEKQKSKTQKQQRLLLLLSL